MSKSNIVSCFNVSLFPLPWPPKVTLILCLVALLHSAFIYLFGLPFTRGPWRQLWPSLAMFESALGPFLLEERVLLAQCCVPSGLVLSMIWNHSYNMKAYLGLIQGMGTLQHLLSSVSFRYGSTLAGLKLLWASELLEAIFNDAEVSGPRGSDLAGPGRVLVPVIIERFWIGSYAFQIWEALLYSICFVILGVSSPHPDLHSWLEYLSPLAKFCSPLKTGLKCHHCI